jgi:hypothetical protein
MYDPVSGSQLVGVFCIIVAVSCQILAEQNACAVPAKGSFLRVCGAAPKEFNDVVFVVFKVPMRDLCFCYSVSNSADK